MNIAMFTNLYLPLVGGLQRSVAIFKDEFRRRNHRVLVVAPAMENSPENDPTVVHVPAIQHFYGTEFSVALPIPGYLTSTLDRLAPDVIHSHHPFLLGMTAVRAAARRDCPLVLTYHTMWEHYAPNPPVQAFLQRMAVEYCELCDHVIAPTPSVADILRRRGVRTPISVIPTGIDLARFARGAGGKARRQFNIPHGAFVAGQVGRLAHEKNLGLLADALASACQRAPALHVLIVGDGDMAPRIREPFEQLGVADRLHMPGVLNGQALIDAYHALDVFAFSSKSETQGLVLVEAMAAGCPVIALHATGTSDIVVDGLNGRLLTSDTKEALAAAVLEAVSWPRERRLALRRAARQTAATLSAPVCAERTLELYSRLLHEHGRQRCGNERNAPAVKPGLAWALRQLAVEWRVWTGRANALCAAFAGARKLQVQS